MPDLQTMLALRFRQAVVAAFGPDQADTDPLIRPAANPRFGDFQANLAMSLAKSLGAKPRDIAQRIVEHLPWQDLCAVEPSIAGPGFINLQLAETFLGQRLQEAAADPRLGVQPVSAPQTVVVDYSGPNVAKEMHVGHLRSTVIGDSIARVLECQGHRVIRQNHLGDWGTQFGMLIEHLADEGWSADDATGRSVRDLNSLYQQAKAKFDSDAAFAERSRRRVVALQGGDRPTQALWRALIDESMRHFNEVYRRLGVKLTDRDVCPESFYNERLPGVVAELEQSQVAVASQGAVCVFPAGFKGPDGQDVPLIVRKSDGGYGYATTDLAALRYRVRDLGAQRIVYVVDARQRQHLAMVFEAGRMAGWITPSIRVEHVAFGTVLGEDNKPFKTRSGDTVKLADLLDEAEQRAARVIAQKNPSLSADTSRQVAQAVGIGAIKYADLCNDRVKDYVFSWDRMLSFDGNTAPYLQNAYVRIRSIFRKAESQGLIPPAAGPIAVKEPAERVLGLKLLLFPQAVASVAESLEPHRLCTYLYELASAYHSFYEACPVLTAPNDESRNSRLRLSDLTARTLHTGLELLGLHAPEQM